MQDRQKCSIISLNVRGLRDQIKRRSIFSYLKDQKATFYLLQETYSNSSDEMSWKDEWGGDIVFSHGSCHSRGVCILMGRNVKQNVDFVFRDTCGRIVLISITINGQKITLCNIYAPNNSLDQLQFMQELNCCLVDKAEITTLIIGGDWNCTLSKKDKSGGAPWRPTSYRNSVLITMDIFDLLDIQRIRHPNVNKISYTSKALKMKSRIDFFLIAKNVSKFVKKVDIQPSIAPDHKIIYLLLSWPKENPRGPGLWKFNNSLLTEEYTAEICELYPRFRERLSYIQDKSLFWEMLKMEIRNATIAFAKDKVKVAKKREEEIKKQLDCLDNKICNSINLENVDSELEKYEGLKNELKLIYKRKGKAAMFRSKCKWVEEGEKATKYFFNLEKRNYNRKVVTEIDTETGTLIADNAQILTEIEDYYKDLYSSKTTNSQESFENFIQNVEIPKLSVQEKDELEAGYLTFEECKKIIETFPNDKSPGEDGFTAEFYKHFFDLVGHDLVESLNTAYDIGKLSISQRRGMIILLPKGDEPLTQLKNWRPITLLNVDYKIASKAIAKRLEATLDKLVHPDQTGFIRGRYIGENIRLINDVMEDTKKQNSTGILISVDFQKAFDSLEWSSILSALQANSIGEGFLKWIRLFYTDIESAVINNGYLTSWFKPSRGVRQGCPLSPYLFILTAEILSNAIRQDTNIKGIRIFGNEIKLTQFADNTNLFCADLDSVSAVLNKIKTFSSFSGLKLNIEKTKAIWLGR